MSNYEDPSTDFFGQGHITTSSSASRLSSGEFKFHSSFRTTETILSSLIGGSILSSGSGPHSSASNHHFSNFVVANNNNNSTVSHVNTMSCNNVNSSGSNSSSFGGVGQLAKPAVERGNSSGSIEFAAPPHSPLPHSPTPPLQRRLAKSFSVAPAITEKTKGYIKILINSFFSHLFSINSLFYFI